MDNKSTGQKQVAFVKADTKDYEAFRDMVKAFCKAMKIPWKDDDEDEIRAIWEKNNPPAPAKE
jgi:hypothetical protein